MMDQEIPGAGVELYIPRWLGYTAVAVFTIGLIVMAGILGAISNEANYDVNLLQALLKEETTKQLLLKTAAENSKDLNSALTNAILGLIHNWHNGPFDLNKAITSIAIKNAVFTNGELKFTLLWQGGTQAGGQTLNFSWR